MTSRTGAPRPRSGGAPSAPTTFTRAMQRVFGLFRARAGAHFPREPGQRPEFESLEPRLLLSADLLAPAVAALLAPSERQDGALIAAPTHVAAGEPPAIRFAVTDHATPASGFAGQTIYLDLDGAEEVSYRGPVTVEVSTYPRFAAPDALAGQEQAIAELLVETLQQASAGTGLLITSEQPGAGETYSTVYIGGDGAAFRSTATTGVSRRRSTPATGTAPTSPSSSATPSRSTRAAWQAYATGLAGYVAHEAGHLLGFEHAHTVHHDDAGDVLAEVAFQPHTHVEIAKDVRDDVIRDGRLTINGNEYDVHPKIVEALTKYPVALLRGRHRPGRLPRHALRPSDHPSGRHRRLAAAPARHGLGVADRPRLDARGAAAEPRLRLRLPDALGRRRDRALARQRVHRGGVPAVRGPRYGYARAGERRPPLHGRGVHRRRHARDATTTRTRTLLPDGDISDNAHARDHQLGPRRASSTRR